MPLQYSRIWKSLTCTVPMSGRICVLHLLKIPLIERASDSTPACLDGFNSSSSERRCACEAVDLILALVMLDAGVLQGREPISNRMAELRENRPCLLEPPLRSVRWIVRIHFDRVLVPWENNLTGRTHLPRASGISLALWPGPGRPNPTKQGHFLAS